MEARGLDWKSRSLLPRLLYMVQCRNRYKPADNNIGWWRTYVSEFFAQGACMALNLKELAVFKDTVPDALQCTEVPYDLLPRLLQYKYENGVVEELLFLGNVIESAMPNGGTSIICYQAAEHLVFAGYSLIQYGHLKVAFNAQLKVQLMEFSVTGYDLHIEHSALSKELTNAVQVLDERSKSFADAQAAGSSLSSASVSDSLQQSANLLRAVSQRMETYLTGEWAYIQKMLHFQQVADTASSMHELFHKCLEEGVSPIAAMRSFGALSARVGPWPGEQQEPASGHGQGGFSTGTQQVGSMRGPTGLCMQHDNHSPSLSQSHAALSSLLAVKQRQQQQQQQQQGRQSVDGNVSPALPSTSGRGMPGTSGGANTPSMSMQGATSATMLPMSGVPTGHMQGLHPDMQASMMTHMARMHAGRMQGGMGGPNSINLPTGLGSGGGPGMNGMHGISLQGPGGAGPGPGPGVMGMDQSAGMFLANQTALAQLKQSLSSQALSNQGGGGGGPMGGLMHNPSPAQLQQMKVTMQVQQMRTALQQQRQQLQHQHMQQQHQMQQQQAESNN